MNDNIILGVKDLCAAYGERDAISGISFELRKGEALCVVGQSGCGKSTLLKSIIGVFDSPTVTSGSIVFDGSELTQLGQRARSKITTEGMGLIFQTPGAAFNPIRSYKKQFIETLKSHGKYDAQAFLPSVQDVFARLGLDDAQRILAACPYEMSGGMNQRIALALVMLMRQRLLLADEPTSALDALTRRTVADELTALRTQLGISQIIVTHDLALAAYVSDRIAVMHAGRLVELAPARELVTAPLHPYTISLLESLPRLGGILPTAPAEFGEFHGVLTEHGAGHFVLTEV